MTRRQRLHLALQESGEPHSGPLSNSLLRLNEKRREHLLPVDLGHEPSCTSVPISPPGWTGRPSPLTGTIVGEAGKATCRVGRFAAEPNAWTSPAT
jgi:hypothetical protein